MRQSSPLTIIVTLVLTALAAVQQQEADAFVPSGAASSHRPLYAENDDNSDHPHKSRERRLLLNQFTTAFAAVLLPRRVAHAGIDVSGLRVDGGGNSVLRQQLNAYDGSAATRVQQASQLGQMRSASTATTTTVVPTSGLEEIGPAATYAYRATPGFKPGLSKLGLGERYHYDDKIVSPTNVGYLRIGFDFPSDWLQLDRILGGIQYVDQRNGDKLYVLKAKLPEPLTTVPKQFFGQSLFDVNGTLVKSGIEIDEYKVTKSTILSDGSVSNAHRRLLIKYYSVTGNGLRTERRGLVDAYDIDGVAYMLFTGSNAAKFEANGRERETVEKIVNSFTVEKIL